jgi:type IV pilus assembly protein PilX
MKALTPFRRPRSTSKARQRGAALFVSMVMLLLILMLAVVGMRTVTLESRIAGNALESQRLQEIADGTLREGERIIQQFGIALAPCATGATSPLLAVGTPCFISEARTDTLGLNSAFGVNARAVGFENPFGYWYPRYISTECPKGKSPTAALDAADTGCTEFYEVNAQATLASDAPRPCGPDALCLRSSVNLFIK